MTDDLFSRSRLLEHAANQQRDAIQQVKAAPEDRVVDDAVGLAEELIARYTLQRVTLDQQGIERSEPRQETETVYDGARPTQWHRWAITLYVPFSGSAAAFTLQANQHLMGGFPRGTVHGSTLELEVRSSEADAAAINREAKQQLELVQRLIGFANTDIDLAYRELDAAVRKAVHDRSQAIKQRREIDSGLDFPVRRQRSTSRDW